MTAQEAREGTPGAARRPRRLVVEVTASPEADGAIAAEWFTGVWERLGGWLRHQLDRHPLPDHDVTLDLHTAHLDRHYPADGLPFLLLAGHTTASSGQDWNRLYGPAAWADFLAFAAGLPRMAALVNGGVVQSEDPMLPPRTPGGPGFNATMWRRDASEFKLLAHEDFLAGSPRDQAALVEFVQAFAQRCGASVAHCGPVDLTEGYPLRRTTGELRGYSWLTFVPPASALRLGGAAAARASGAFARVETTPEGGLWLLATDRVQNFDAAAADQVRVVLQPLSSDP